MTPEERSKQIMAEADKLVAEARRSIDEGERTLRSLGINREKMLDVTADLRRQMNEQQSKECHDQQMKDQEEIEQATRHAAEAARSTGGAPKRPRNMV